MTIFSKETKYFGETRRPLECATWPQPHDLTDFDQAHGVGLVVGALDSEDCFTSSMLSLVIFHDSCNSTL